MTRTAIEAAARVAYSQWASRECGMPGWDQLPAAEQWHWIDVTGATLSAYFRAEESAA